jgi:putative hydrolase of the HAD superfamily
MPLSEDVSFNIVFDLGGVVFRWQPEVILKSLFENAETQDRVRTGIFEHPDWVELDRGTLGLNQAIERGADRTGLAQQEVERLLEAVPRFLTPINETIDLIRTLTDSSHRLFVLSNMHAASIQYLEATHDIWSMFDGIVISSRIQKVKPEIEIYEHLLAVHQLKPGETIFIDDMRENLEAASSIGIQTIHFVDPAQCRRALVDLNCL